MLEKTEETIPNEEYRHTINIGYKTEKKTNKYKAKQKTKQKHSTEITKKPRRGPCGRHR